MSDHRIDNIIQQRLSDGSMSVPPGMWNKIEARLPAPASDRRPLLIWFVGGLVLIVALLLWTSRTGLSAPENNHISAITTQTPIDAVRSVQDSKTSSVNLVEQEGIVLIPENATFVTPTASLSFSRSASVDDRPQEAAVVVSESKTEPATPRDSVNMEFLGSSISILSRTWKRLPPDPSKGCYDFGGKKGLSGKWFLEGYTGPSFPTRQLTSRAEDVSSYIAMRNSTESTRLSWHGGLRGGFRHHSGLSARIGVHYSHVHEVFDYYSGSVTQTVTRIDSIFDAGGNLVGTDTVIVTQRGQRIKRTHNRFHAIDIPVLLGYEISHQEWNYGIQAGPVFNLAFIKKGDILASTGDPVSISDNDAMPYPAFKDHLGLSLFASVHIGRSITDGLLLYGEPFVHHRLRSLTLETYPIDQRQTLFGFSIGMRLILN